MPFVLTICLIKRYLPIRGWSDSPFAWLNWPLIWLSTLITASPDFRNPSFVAATRDSLVFVLRSWSGKWLCYPWICMLGWIHSTKTVIDFYYWVSLPDFFSRHPTQGWQMIFQTTIKSSLIFGWMSLFELWYIFRLLFRFDAHVSLTLLNLLQACFIFFAREDHVCIPWLNLFFLAPQNFEWACFIYLFIW